MLSKKTQISLQNVATVNKHRHMSLLFFQLFLAQPIYIQCMHYDDSAEPLNHLSTDGWIAVTCFLTTLRDVVSLVKPKTCRIYHYNSKH